MSPELGARTIAKVTRRLVPFAMLLFVLSYLDRVNVGFAALQMTMPMTWQPGSSQRPKRTGSEALVAVITI